MFDFIATGTTPESVAAFSASQQSKDHVTELLHREKTTGLTRDETSELDHYLQIEHVMRLAKARARMNLRTMTSYVSADLRRLVAVRRTKSV